MRIVVFGGAGFLGSHVADALTEAGHEVIIFDRKESCYLTGSQRMVVGDILDQKTVSGAVKGADAVYNFAGLADIEEASSKPLDTVKFNVLGNTIVLECCREYGVKRFVYASTLYVYSKSGGFYRSSKQACELIIDNYHESYGLDYTILRYGSLYGPRSDDRNFIHRILKQAFVEGKIVREGDGEEIREYVHVKDAARSSIEILSDEYANQHVIITGYQQTKIKDLLLMIKEMLEGRITLEFLPAAGSLHYEITPYVFAPRLAKRIINRDYIDLGQGVLDMIYEISNEVEPHPTIGGLVLEDEGQE